MRVTQPCDAYSTQNTRKPPHQTVWPRQSSTTPCITVYRKVSRNTTTFCLASEAQSDKKFHNLRKVELSPSDRRSMRVWHGKHEHFGDWHFRAQYPSFTCTTKSIAINFEHKGRSSSAVSPLYSFHRIDCVLLQGRFRRLAVTYFKFKTTLRKTTAVQGHSDLANVAFPMSLMLSWSFRTRFNNFSSKTWFARRHTQDSVRH